MNATSTMPAALDRLVVSSAEFGLLTGLGESPELLASWRLELEPPTWELVLDGLLARGVLAANAAGDAYGVAPSVDALVAPLLTAAVEVEAIVSSDDATGDGTPPPPSPGVRAIIGANGAVEHAALPDGLHELVLSSAAAVAERVVGELGLAVPAAGEPVDEGAPIHLTVAQLGEITERLAAAGVAAAEAMLPDRAGYVRALAAATGVRTVDVHHALIDHDEGPITATLSWIDGGTEGCWTLGADDDGVTVRRVARATLAGEIAQLIDGSDAV